MSRSRSASAGSKQLRAGARSRASILAAGKIATTASQGLLLVIIARFEGAHAVGLYTLALAIVSPLFLLAHMRAQDVVATHPAPERAWRPHALLVAAVGLLAAAAAALIAVLWPTAGLLAFVLPLIFIKLGDSVTAVCHGYRNAYGRVTQTAASTTLRSVTSVLALGVGAWFLDVTSGLWLVALAGIVQLLVWDLRRMPRALGDRLTLDTVVSCLPLGVVALLLSVNQSVIRGVLDLSVGTAALGIFASTAYLVRAGSVLAQASAQASSPSLREVQRLGTPEGAVVALRCARDGVLIGIGLLIVGIPAGPPLIGALFGPEFVPGHAFIASVLVAGIPLFGATAMSTAAVATSSRADYLVAVLAGIAGTGVAAAVLIPALGLTGAGLAWAIGESVKFILMVSSARRRARA